MWVGNANFNGGIANIRDMIPLGAHFLCPLEIGVNKSNTVTYQNTTDTQGFNYTKAEFTLTMNC